MKRVGGTFNGTGAALYLGIGFVPDWVKVWNMEDGDAARLVWNRNMQRSAEMTEGLLQADDNDTAPDPRTVTDGGIRPFYSNGTTVTSASTSYLVLDDDDYRESDTYGTIDTWTLDTSANRTGHFNLEADTTYIGEGSIIRIRETMGQQIEEAAIVALTSNGEQADEVTLSRAVTSGDVLFIGRMYDYVGASANTVIPDGFSIHATDVINVSGEMCCFEAGTYY
jgi:hypothetical protein